MGTDSQKTSLWKSTSLGWQVSCGQMEGKNEALRTEMELRVIGEAFQGLERCL